MPHKYRTRITKIALSVAFTVLSYGVLTTPAVTSFYGNADIGISLTVWISVVAIPMTTTLYALSQFFDEETPVNRETVFLVTAALGGALIVLFHFPEIRGYELYGRGGADVLSHLGQVRTILETGHVVDENWYPISHILLSVLVLMGLPFNYTPTFVTTAFTVLYVGFIALYFRWNPHTPLYRRNEYTLVALSVSSILVFMTYHRSFHPAILSFVFAPLFLCLLERDYFEEGRHRTAIVLFTLLVFLLPFHPATFVILSIIIVGFFISVSLKRYFDTGGFRRLRLPAVVLMALGFYLWYFQFENTFDLLTFSLLSILGRQDEVSGEGVQAANAVANLDLIEVIMRGIELYGPLMILTGTAGVGLAVLLWTASRRGVHSLSELHLSTQVVISVLFGLVFLLVPVFGSGIVRVLRYYILIATLLTILCLITLRYRTPNLPKRANIARYLAIGVIIVGVLVALPISFYGIYDSNYHLTETEESGTDWYLSSYDDTSDTYSTHMTYKMEYYLKGVHEVDRSQGAFRRFGVSVAETPTDLGYANNTPVQTTFGDDSYIIIKDYDLHTTLDPRHVLRLHTDPTTGKVYENGGYSVWHIP